MAFVIKNLSEKFNFSAFHAVDINFTDHQIAELKKQNPKIDFQNINNKCQSVIDSYDIFSDIALWLEEHKSLFNQINIQPKGLPGICNSNFEGIKYEYISKFHQLYSKVKYEYSILSDTVQK